LHLKKTDWPRRPSFPDNLLNHSASPLSCMSSLANEQRMDLPSSLGDFGHGLFRIQ
jgi:hypothetical protein